MFITNFFPPSISRWIAKWNNLLSKEIYRKNSYCLAIPLLRIHVEVYETSDHKPKFFFQYELFRQAAECILYVYIFIVDSCPYILLLMCLRSWFMPGYNLAPIDRSGIDQKNLCPRCDGLLREAVQTIVCGHRYCKTCMDIMLR